MNILIIGGGNMGKTFAASFLRSKIISKEELFIYEKDNNKVAELNQESMGTAFSGQSSYFENADMIILAVKPQDAGSIYPIIKKYQPENKIIISIMAGIKMNVIEHHLGVKKLVRTMPNLACQLGKGVIGYKASPNLTEDDKELVQKLLATTGKVIEVKEESMLDAITALSGSGPAYVFYFMDAMMHAATQFGFSDQEAEQIVTQTFEGSVQLFKKNNLTCQEWIDRVSSKGGTTEAALKVFDEYDIKNHIGKGILRAESRSEELSRS